MIPWVPADVTYMRWIEDDKVMRVARSDGEIIFALYSSENPDIFYGKSLEGMSDVSPRSKVKREMITDEIFLKLLDGTPLDEVRGEIFADHYLVSGTEDNPRTFSVSDHEKSSF